MSTEDGYAVSNTLHEAAFREISQLASLPLQSISTNMYKSESMKGAEKIRQLGVSDKLDLGETKRLND